MNNETGGGIGIVGVLTLIFVVLKLVGVISWSWWWVLSPLWISFGLGLVILFFVGLIFVVTSIWGDS
jgi:hypothetical protein